MKRLKRGIWAALAALFLSCILMPQTEETAYALDGRDIDWDLTIEPTTGEVTHIEALWWGGESTGVYTYIVWLYKYDLTQEDHWKQIGQYAPETNRVDVTDGILSHGPGRYRVDGLVMTSIYTYADMSMYISEQLYLYDITVDTGGHGESFTARNIVKGTSYETFLGNTYIKDLTGSTEAGGPIYEDGQALVAVTQQPKEAYSDSESLLAETVFLMSDEEQTALQASGIGDGTSDGGEITLYAAWFDVIDQVDLTVEPRECGTRTATSKDSNGEWRWQYQTYTPNLTIPAGAPYVKGKNATRWVTDNTAEEPYIGVLSGDGRFRFAADLTAAYGYVFPETTQGTLAASVNGENAEVWRSSVTYTRNNKGYVTGITDSLRVIHTIGVEHRWNSGEVTTPSTCVKKGVKTYTCNYCPVQKTEPMPLGDHSWDTGRITTQPTCTKAGVKTYTCRYNSSHTRTEEVAATGHSWDAGRITTQPTCTKAGVKTYTCTHNASHTRTEEVEATGHDWDSGKITTQPTCTKKGVKTYTCLNNSSHTKTKAVEALGHDYSKEVIVKATPDKDGAVLAKCSRCSASVEKESISRPRTVKLSPTSYNYDGTEHEPSVTVRDESGSVIKAANYTVSYKNNRAAGTGTVRVTFKGDRYSGSLTQTFSIQQVSVAYATVKGIADMTYTGRALEPASTVLVDGRTLTAGTDYTVSYKNNIGPGTAVLTITGRGNYEGTKKINFSIRYKNLPFTDVRTWDNCYDAVQWAFNTGIVKGKSSTIFAPQDGLTRGEFCTMLWRMFGRQSVDGMTCPFKDAKASNHYKAILWCYNRGIIKGYKTADGTDVFRPSRKITRTNILVMLFKLARKESGYKAPAAGNPFTDVSDGDKNLVAYRWAWQNSVVTDRTLAGKAYCTRGDMVRFLFGYNNAYRVVK